MPETVARARERSGSTVQDRVLGAVGVAMVVGAIWLLLFGGPPDATVSSDTPPPQLQLISPIDGDTIDPPLQIRFRSALPLTPQPGGWGSAGFHVHADIAGREVMPGSGDIAREQDGSYLWVIRQVPIGRLEMRLFWSDAQHVPVAGGGTEEISVLVR